MDLEESLDGHRRGARQALDRPRHCIDVPQHLCSRDVRDGLAERSHRLGTQESPPSYDEPLDVRRRHRLCSQQQTRQCLSVDERGHRRVEAGDRRLSIGDVSRDFPFEPPLSAHQRIRDVRLVLAPATVAAGVALE